MPSHPHVLWCVVAGARGMMIPRCKSAKWHKSRKGTLPTEHILPFAHVWNALCLSVPITGYVFICLCVSWSGPVCFHLYLFMSLHLPVPMCVNLCLSLCVPVPISGYPSLSIPVCSLCTYHSLAIYLLCVSRSIYSSLYLSVFSILTLCVSIKPFLPLPVCSCLRLSIPVSTSLWLSVFSAACLNSSLSIHSHISL